MSELFIGGPADGKRFTVPQPAHRFYATGGPDDDPQCYHRERIAGIGQEIYVWRWDGITVDACLVKLVEGYNP